MNTITSPSGSTSPFVQTSSGSGVVGELTSNFVLVAVVLVFLILIFVLLTYYFWTGTAGGFFLVISVLLFFFLVAFIIFVEFFNSSNTGLGPVGPVPGPSPGPSPGPTPPPPGPTNAVRYGDTLSLLSLQGQSAAACQEIPFIPGFYVSTRIPPVTRNWRIQSPTKPNGSVVSYGDQIILFSTTSNTPGTAMNSRLDSTDNSLYRITEIALVGNMLTTINRVSGVNDPGPLTYTDIFTLTTVLIGPSGNNQTFGIVINVNDVTDNPTVCGVFIDAVPTSSIGSMPDIWQFSNT